MTSPQPAASDLAQVAQPATLMWLRRGDRAIMLSLRREVGHALREAVRAARVSRGVAASRVVGIDDAVDVT